jgi:hypothetical protein
MLPTNELALLGANKQDFNLLENSDSNALSVLHVGRTLLSDYDYDQNDLPLKPPNNESTFNKNNLINNNELMNLSNKNTINSSLELVNINDTWHFIDPNICAKNAIFNHTHSIKYVFINLNLSFNFSILRINTELYGWYERYNKASKSNVIQKNKTSNDNQIVNSLPPASEQKPSSKFRIRSIVNNESKKIKKK